ncbi:CerR family C-terminal domain-containing protein [Sphingomonas bacterium]|uniref:CerR family C-terminal domain-containing protein n=1 Tax=Sphingomonas bacterium TaxID=1895847 RepID=UPI0015767DAB|nr:CerR family C-terminal domain-containing protein [Sphingomonas bacterium]
MPHDRLLSIATREFGLKGLDGASTRGIAAAAGTAMSSITYHFGGKDGLYLAAADHVTAHMAANMGETLAAEQAVTDDDPAAARALIHAIFAQLIAGMSDEGSADISLFVMREQMNPTEAFDRIYGGLMGQMLDIIARLVRIATGSDDERSARIMTMLLLGQALTPRLCRASMLRLLHVETIEAADDEAIRRQVKANTDASIDSVIADLRCGRDVAAVTHSPSTRHARQ